MIKYITPDGKTFDSYRSIRDNNKNGAVTCMKDIIIMQLSSNLSYIGIDIPTGKVKIGITKIDF